MTAQAHRTHTDVPTTQVDQIPSLVSCSITELIIFFRYGRLSQSACWNPSLLCPMNTCEHTKLMNVSKQLNHQKSRDFCFYACYSCLALRSSCVHITWSEADALPRRPSCNMGSQDAQAVRKYVAVSRSQRQGQTQCADTGR